MGRRRRAWLTDRQLPHRAGRRARRAGPFPAQPLRWERDPLMRNLTVRYWTPDDSSRRRAELPGLGIVPARLALTVEHYGPRTDSTRMGIVHRATVGKWEI